ncbi:M24 family metallopeptidase [Fimbriiglobus ruber]|uniref:Aminopeptidase YpdF (MP-, MA-, MS-, AP-, NP-specific) n=1 Tax=Fimbriiglobus ruber TaxID=1908690 RepID=A0A225DBQ2_9BACT|nr:Xaa-Pro peptidase family protein [Fimbriiglobus ruber]OWK34579.1 Aminopeptidase YpdF (MP-, MA-, MS-, AP-, NP- specific) [Fimbriiglobus ruber]
MLTADGCKGRRQALLARLQHGGPLLLGDPLNLRYFANFYADPFSLGADYGGLLLIAPDGRTTLFHDHRAPKSVEFSLVDERIPLMWYDGKSPGRGPRRLILREAIDRAATGGRVHDQVTDPLAPALWEAVTEMRRVKAADELSVLNASMRATEAGHAWARANVRPGMTELEVYTGMFQACTLAAGQANIVYGDFAVSPGSKKRGGAPTSHVIAAGETLILDYSVVIQGYRSDFTNTLVVGAEPTNGQRRLFDLSVAAMAAGEQKLKAGAACLDVYRAVRGVFEAAGVADNFPHHAGHGIGLSHPEAPFFVEKATETLVAGDVVTLEPGLYVDNVGGVRIENNYLITGTGFEKLSHHTISLG